MKKRSHYFKPLGLICFLLLGVALIIASCKKTSSQNEQGLNLDDLKTWQAKNFDHNALLFNSLEPDWNKVFVNDQGKEDVYEVEVINKEKLFLSMGFTDQFSSDSVAAKSKIKLLLVKDKESGNITDGYYMVTISDQIPHYKKYGSYTGAIYYYGKNGNFLNGYVYEKGTITKGLQGGNSELYRASINERLELKPHAFGREKLQLKQAEQCYTDVSPVYGFSCIGAGDYSECNAYIKGYNYVTVCSTVGDNGDTGGGGTTGDGSGGVIGGHPGGHGGNGGTPPEVPEETEEQKEARRQTDCATFKFTKTSEANWQEAGVNNIKLSWVWIGGSSGAYTSRDLKVSGLIFGFPTYYTNSDGSTTPLKPGKAANRAALAVEVARRLTYSEFRDSPYFPQDAEVKKFFIAKVAALMATNMGTAGTLGSGSDKIVFNDEERSDFTDPLDCDE